MRGWGFTGKARNSCICLSHCQTERETKNVEIMRMDEHSLTPFFSILDLQLLSLFIEEHCGQQHGTHLADSHFEE